MTTTSYLLCPGVSGPVGSYRDKSMSLSPMSSRVSADMTSEGSSTSDEEKRRSGSVERHHHSPDHLRGNMVSEVHVQPTVEPLKGLTDDDLYLM